ncbi:MAG: hypothetical protein LBV54_06895, partial [Puniceicoccales bacterium]|nr:hypothetical protein [Puniceicoccales bacterium]
MKINGTDHLSPGEIQSEVDRGGRFVLFSYAISLFVVTFRRSSDIYFIRPGKSVFLEQGWKFFLISFFLGWWGIPWGPIYTIQALWRSFRGVVVTNEVIANINAE